MRKLRSHCYLATSRFRRIRGAAFGLLKYLIRPPLPALGQLGNGQQSLGLIALMGVDAKYLSNGEFMLGSLDDSDLISGTHIPLDDYA
jgi:hypothetical protein